MEIDLKKAYKAGLTLTGYTYLQIIYTKDEESLFLFKHMHQPEYMETLLEYLETMDYIIIDDKYDVILRTKAEKLFEDLEEIKEIRFNEFWNNWHQITNLPKTDKVAAEKYWKKLTKKERVLAIENIEDYYNSLNDKRFCKKARTYLGDKNFNDEFVNNEISNSTEMI